MWKISATRLKKFYEPQESMSTMIYITVKLLAHQRFRHKTQIQRNCQMHPERKSVALRKKRNRLMAKYATQTLGTEENIFKIRRKCLLI